MRFFLSIVILLTVPGRLWASVNKAASASSQALSTIQGPILASSPSISALPEDCLSPVDWHDIIFITAVPIAAGFGLLLLLAFLQDFRQAYKSNRSCRPAPPTIRGNRAIKERSYIIDVDYAGRSRWCSFLRWCATHKSSAANKNPRLVRLQGTVGFSDWLSFDLILGLNSEQKTVTTPRSIGKLVAVETKYSSPSDGLNSRQLPSSNIAACLQGLINRACGIEIKNIQVTDAKTQDHYISGCGPSSGGISSSDQGITTILPLLLSNMRLSSRVNYVAYYLKHGSLWTSTFIPWSKGNFTGARHITCLFACISYTMVAAEVMSGLSLKPFMEEAILANVVNINITLAIVIRAIVVGIVVFSLLVIMETVFWGAPTIWSLHPSCASPRAQNGNPFINGSLPTHVQSAPGDFYSGSCDNTEEGLPRVSTSAPEIQHWGTGTRCDASNQQTNDISSHCSNICKRCAACSDTQTEMNDTSNSKSDIEPAHSSSNGLAVTVSDDICGDNQSICAANMLECQHKFACFKCCVCKRTTGNRYYHPGAGCSGEPTPLIYANLYGYGGLTCPRYSSSSLDLEESTNNILTNDTPLTNFSRSISSGSLSSLSCSDWNVSTSFSDSSFCISGQPLDDSDPYDTQIAITITSQDDLNHMEKHQSASSMQSSQQRLDSFSRVTCTSGNQCKNISKQEAGDGRQATKCHGKQCEMKQEDTNAIVGFKEYSASLNDANINSAKVLRTKNYINRFTDMGKGQVVFLPHQDAKTKSFDVLLPIKDKSNTKHLTDAKSVLYVSGTTTEPKTDNILETTIECGSMSKSDYIIDLPMAFEMPSVTIQSSSSHKLFFFNVRKWLGGLRSKRKVDVGDDYKLEVTEHDAAAIKTSDENTCLSSQHEDDEVQMNKPGDHLQGSIFQSTSRIIEYQPEVISLASLGSWSNISSPQDAPQNYTQLTPHMDAKIANKNNSNEETIINMDPSTTLPFNTSSDEYLSLDSSKSSSDSSSPEPKSTSTEGIHSSNISSSNSGKHTCSSKSICSEDICSSKICDSDICNTKSTSSKGPCNNGSSNQNISSSKYICDNQDTYSSHDICSSPSNICRSNFSSSTDMNIVLSEEDSRRYRYKYYQTMYDVQTDITSTEDHSEFIQPVIFLIGHILLIASCVFAVLWSVSSVHGLCWSAFSEWVATSIIAVLIQAVVLDTIKAGVITLARWYHNYNDTKPKPYSVIY